MTPEKPTPRSLLLAILCLLATLVSCHDARRENPFDPMRTPAVELTAILHDSTGTAALTWTRYAGSAPFGHYLVLRSVEILGGQQVDTLATIDDAGQTAFVDTSVIHGASYTYRVSAVNNDGFEVPSPVVEVGPVGLPAVEITGLTFDSASATAALQWTPYAGRGFAAYHVRRSTPELAPADRAVLADPAATAYVDSNLVGATEYTYRVVVRTGRGEEVASEGETGGIHRLLAEWPLPVEAGEYVRLYARDASGVRVLATRLGQRPRVRTLPYSHDGRVLEETVVATSTHYVATRGTAMAVDPGGRQTLCQVEGYRVMLMPLPVREEVWEPFTAALDTVDAGSARVRGQVSLMGLMALGNELNVGGFDDAALWANNVQVLSEDFGAFPPGGVESRVNGWEFIGGGETELGVLLLRDNSSGTRASESWDSDRIRFEADVWVFTGGGIRLGGDTLWRFTLSLREGQAALELECRSCGQQEQAPTTFTEALPIVPDVRYRLTLEMADGNIRAAVSSPVYWSQGLESGDWTWASAAPVEETVAFALDEVPFSLSPDGEFTAHTVFDSYVGELREFTAHTVFDSHVGELRSWNDANGRGTRMGACFPELGKIGIGLVPAGRGPDWRRYMTRSFGPRVSAEVGFLAHPVSLDGGPDGRMFVLDAGNSRIVAFDADGQYITQWGRRGSGPGEFDFGSGNVIPKGLDFAGSVAVDGEGRVYVAEVANQRIQVFAP